VAAAVSCKAGEGGWERGRCPIIAEISYLFAYEKHIWAIVFEISYPFAYRQSLLRNYMRNFIYNRINGDMFKNYARKFI
jgi:predicted transglutaminase-like protease